MRQDPVLSTFLRSLLVLALVVFGACGGETSNSTSQPADQSEPAATAPSPSTEAPFSKADVENACSLLAKTMVRKATGLPDTASLKKKTVPPSGKTPDECAYTWTSETKQASGRVIAPEVYDKVSSAQSRFENLTPTLSKKEMTNRVQRATKQAAESGQIDASDAKKLQALATQLAESDSINSVVWVDVADIGTRARVQLQGAASTSYATAVQYKNVVFKTSAYYGPDAKAALPNTDPLEAGLEFLRTFRRKTSDRRIRMGKALARLVVDRLQEKE